MCQCSEGPNQCVLHQKPWPPPSVSGESHNDCVTRQNRPNRSKRTLLFSARREEELSWAPTLFLLIIINFFWRRCSFIILQKPLSHCARRPTLRLFCWLNLDLRWSSARVRSGGRINVWPSRTAKKKKKKNSHQNNSVCPESSRLRSLEPAGSASSDGRDYRMMAVEEQVGPAGRI